MKKQFINVAIIFALLFICHIPYAQGLSVTKTAIAKINSLYFELFKNKDTAIVNLYTPDACLLAPNAPAICGKAALSKDFVDTYKGGLVLGVKFATKDVYGSGEYVTEEGYWQVFGTDGRVIDKGKYLKLWKKEKDGLKIFRDIFNSNQKSK